jgi:hypothetical protein
MGYSPDNSPQFEGFYNRSPGLSSVGQYQIAGTPFITGSDLADGTELQISFPQITKSITVINSDATGNDEIRVHFASKDANGGNTISKNHYITLDSKNSSVTFNVKASSIYISNDSGNLSSFKLFAELTGIDEGYIATLSGVGIDA